MGASSSSPRDLTVQEDTTSGGVKVSEAVARRLVGQPEPNPIPAPTQNLESESELREEISQLEAKYGKRIEALEKHHKELRNVSKDEFAKAVEEVEKKFSKIKEQKPICEDLKKAVMECYQYNPKQTLLCNQVVKNYQRCVQEQREMLLTRGDEDCKPCMLAQMARGPCGMHFMKAYDCYLEEGPEEKCGMLYLEMKDCWDAHPQYGYNKIIDKAYDDIPASKQKANKDKEPVNKDSSQTPIVETKSEKVDGS